MVLVKGSSVAPNASSKASAECSTSDAAVSACQKPKDGTPKERIRLLAVCSTRGQLDHFPALALQQHGQQPLCVRVGFDFVIT